MLRIVLCIFFVTYFIHEMKWNISKHNLLIPKIEMLYSACLIVIDK